LGRHVILVSTALSLVVLMTLVALGLSKGGVGKGEEDPVEYGPPPADLLVPTVSLPTPTPVPGSPALPDLETTVPGRIYIEVSQAGRKLLRFSTTVRNVGEGPIALEGKPDRTGKMIATQIIRLHGGGSKNQVVGTFVRSASHRHWHLENFALFELWPAGGSAPPQTPARTQNKITFCLLDETPIQPPPANVADRPEFIGCDWQHQGISEGWMETYVATLPEQWVDVTGLPGGTYHLRVTLDPDSILHETDRSNNTVTLTIAIQGNSVTVAKAPQTP
jgi:hypothetical protein